MKASQLTVQPLILMEEAMGKVLPGLRDHNRRHNLKDWNHGPVDYFGQEYLPRDVRRSRDLLKHAWSRRDGLLQIWILPTRQDARRYRVGTAHAFAEPSSINSDERQQDRNDSLRDPNSPSPDGDIMILPSV